LSKRDFRDGVVDAPKVAILPVHAGLALYPAFHFRNLQGARLLPFPKLRVTVGEAEHATVVMASAGKIDPPPFVPLRHGEPGVVDAAFVFVDEYKGVGRRRGDNLGKLMPTRAVLWVGDVVHVHVHRHATKAWDLASVANGGTVRGALVNLDRVVVLEKNAGADVLIRGIGVGVALDPGSRSGGPTAT